jgi:hypothetical protein
MNTIRTLVVMLICGLTLCLSSACTQPVVKSTDPLTPTEQLLYSEAIQRGLKDFHVGIPEGTPITLEMSGLRVDQSLHGDVIHGHMKNVVAGWLGRQGLIIRKEEKDAIYRARLIIESLGSTQHVRMVGMPATNAVLLPISTPELALWKRVLHQGYTRFYLDLFKIDSDRFIRSTDPQIGTVTIIDYTAFFFYKWRKTDMELPPPTSSD